MRRRLALLLGAAALACGVSAPLASAPIAAPETKDRLSDEELRRLVQGPLDLFLAGHKQEADEAVRKLASAASAAGDHVRAADILTGYGVALFDAADPDAPANPRQASVPWMAQAVAEARLAWGPSHAETALALQSYADALRKTWPGGPPPEAERALRETLAIRLATLGEVNGETLVTKNALADVLATAPPGALLDPARQAEATSLYRSALDTIPKSRMVDPLVHTVLATMGLARLDARAGRSDDALAGFWKARDLYRREGPGAVDEENACYALTGSARRLAAVLKARGAAAAAAKVETGLGEGGLPCVVVTVPSEAGRP